MTRATYPFTIDALARNEHGTWTARLDIYGQSHAVDRSQGSWRYTPLSKGNWQELGTVYAAALQDAVRRLERVERRVEI